MLVVLVLRLSCFCGDTLGDDLGVEGGGNVAAVTGVAMDSATAAVCLLSNDFRRFRLAETAVGVAVAAAAAGRLDAVSFSSGSLASSSDDEVV